jgi:hypothetical protein
MMVNTYDPNTLEAHEFKANLSCIVKPCLKKQQKSWQKPSSTAKK